MRQSGPAISRYGLESHGLVNLAAARWNYAVPALYEEAIRRGEGVVAESGPLVVRTGQHTGRSPNDKFIVHEPGSESAIWWGEVNRPISVEGFANLRRRLLAYLQGHEVFVQDCFAGADPRFRLKIRVVTETAWHSLFVRQLLIPASPDDLTAFEPGFTILHAPCFHAEPESDGTNSDVFIVLNFAERTVLIGGTSYAGEIKKSVFTILNYLLPHRGVLPMHCSVNVGGDGNCAVFFGLSGTGKTTLSADPERTLVGDDEHGWSDEGLFNFEGGCYAKVIRLNPRAEPEIYATTRRFGTVLENVVIDERSRVLDLDDAAFTENTRGAYPLSYIPNASMTGIAGHPKNIIMLTADAFGVLPPLARLSPEQAMYHFLSGYTAKVAGTEKGLGNEPQATFSACFGAPFMPRHPSVYARMLGEKIARHEAQCWLVNTGWTGGSYGVGHRMEIAYTRALLRAALNGLLAKAPVRRDETFRLDVPESCPDVPAEVLNPRNTWADRQAYDHAAGELAARFHDNFARFEAHVGADVKAAAPKAA
ncbi:MAG: phosphoenolpyruvate carboxykinase [Alphaproteobacteria bacterium]